MNLMTAADKKEVVEQVQQRFLEWSSYAAPWQEQAQEDRLFRFGQQWTEDQERTLTLRGQAPVVVNRVMPAVESAKAMLTANRPSFRCSPREDSDNKVAQVFNGLLEYMYQISDGETAMRQIIDDYYVTGMGVGQIYQDSTADNGKGEIKLRELDPFTVYLDPNMRQRFADDASDILVSKNFSRQQALQLYYMYEELVKEANSNYQNDVPQTTLFNNGEVFFGDIFTPESDYVRGYENYKKITQVSYRVFERFSGKEEVIPEDEWKGYLNRPALIVDGSVIVGMEEILKVKEQIEAQKQAYAQQLAQLQQQLEMQLKEIDLGKREQIAAMVEEANGSDIAMERIQIASERAEMQAAQASQQAEAQFNQAAEQISPPQQVADASYATLLEMDLIKSIPIRVTRIQMDVVVGDKFLYRRILPIEHYPIIVIMNGFTRSPYPTSDVRSVKKLQQYVNKIRSLIMAHAATTTNQKIIVPRGSVDIKEFEEKWNAAGTSVLEVDMEDGAVPIIPQLAALPNALYQDEQTAKNDIDHQLGLYELMQGNAAAAPQTYKATIALDEFGQRKIKSKLMDIEGGLRRMAQVAIPMMQQMWTSEKIARVVQPNNSLTEYAINKRLYDDKGAEIGVMNDITRGSYDVVVVAGSTLPTNRFAQLEFYTDSYKNGIIDRQEVLKKTEIFDMEGVMQRTDEIQQMQQQLQQLTEENKELKGDMQTKDRELGHLQKRVEVEKFKTQLNQTQTTLSSAGEIYKARLADALKAAKQGQQGNTST